MVRVSFPLQTLSDSKFSGREISLQNFVELSNQVSYQIFIDFLPLWIFFLFFHVYCFIFSRSDLGFSISSTSISGWIRHRFSSFMHTDFAPLPNLAKLVFEHIILFLRSKVCVSYFARFFDSSFPSTFQ